MELLLLGTAAAESWPAPFCVCPACEHARAVGGKEIRRRSSALLDGSVLVDLGPDTFSQVQAFGRSLAGITTLVFTHDHSDHLQPDELNYRSPTFSTQTPLPMLQVLGNEAVVDKLVQQYPDADWRREEAKMTFESPLMPFEARTTDDGTAILPLPADHAPLSLVLRLTRGGKHVFYGHDSGLYPEETIAALAGTPLDVALLDCTYGSQKSSNRGHMGVDGVIASVRRLREVGAVTDRTIVVATHYSHNGRATYDQLRSLLEPEGIQASYDGMAIAI